MRGPGSLLRERVLAAYLTLTSTAGTRCLVPVGELSVAFSCALRRDKLDGSERWPSSGSTPNLLRSSGSRPWTAFCIWGALRGSAPNLLRNSGTRPCFAFCVSGELASTSTSTSTKTAWPRCLVHYEDKDSLPRPLRRHGLVASSRSGIAFASFVAFSCALRRDKLDGS